MQRPLFLVVVLLAAAACERPEPPTRTAALPQERDPAPDDAQPPVITWLSDDWDEAKRSAASSGKLVFVDAWAPWCHTCWSMKRDVLHDESLARFLERYVFLEVDTDRPENATLTAQLPVRVWPTFFVVDPATQAIVAANGGSMSLPETVAFLERGLASRSGGAPVDAALAEGYRLWNAGDAKSAAARFEEAAQLEGPRKTEAVGSAVRAWREAKDWSRCTSYALEHLDVVEGSAALGDLSSFLLLCSSKLAGDDALKQRAREAARARLEALVAQPAKGASVDDRADVMGNLADIYEELGKKDEARALHERRLALLEGDAVQAKAPTGQRVHDYARMNSYLALGRGEDAVALFRARIEQLPQDYEAHGRLASTLHQLKRDAEALPVAEKAVELSYGPRRLRYLRLLSDVKGAKGDVEGKRAALAEIVRSNQGLPERMRLDELALEAEVELRAPALK